MFEVLEQMEGHEKDGYCLLRVTPVTVVDLPTPFRIAWSVEGQGNIAAVTFVNRTLSSAKLVDLAPGDIVFLTILGGSHAAFPVGTLLHVRP